MNKSSRRGIKAFMTASAIVPNILIAASLTLAALAIIHVAVQSMFSANCQNIVRFVARSLIEDLTILETEEFAKDEAVVEKLRTALLNDAISVALLDENGNPLIEIESAILSDHHKPYTLRVPVSSHEGAPLGAIVQMEFSTKAIRSLKRNLIGADFALALIITGIAVTLTLRRIEKMVVKRLELLAAASHALGEGNLQARVDASSTDEIGMLGRHFNGMADRIEESVQTGEMLMRELKDKNHQLKEKNRDIEQFTYAVSHDLQTPLVTINNFSQLLMDRDLVHEKGKDWIIRIAKQGQRMDELIKGLLAFSRLSTRAKPHEVVDLGIVLNEALEALSDYLKKKSAVIDLPEKLPKIYAEKVQIRQVFQNLLQNSLKYSKSKVAPQIKVTAEMPRVGFIRICITDNGIGFEPSESKRIFNIFERLHGANSPYKGSGIGLAFCKKIVERHNGVISAMGKLGEGATIVIDLPLDQPKKNRHDNGRKG